MDKTVLDLLQYHQRDIATPEAGQALQALGITPETAHHFQLGYSTGQAYRVASQEQKKLLRRLDLANVNGERFKGAVVFPVCNEMGTLVDLFGLRPAKHRQRQRVQARPIIWHKPPKGHLGLPALKTHPEIILTDFVPYAIELFQHGHQNVIAIRSPEELPLLAAKLEKSEVKRICVLSPQRSREVVADLAATGIETLRLPRPRDGKSPVDSLKRMDEVPLTLPAQATIRLARKTDSRLFFETDSASYRVESLSLAGLGMKVQVRAEAGGGAFLDKVDLASAQARRKFSRGCAMRIGISSNVIEDHLTGIADIIDTMQLEQAHMRTRTRRKLSREEEEGAIALLGSQDILSLQATALETHFGFVAEEKNKRLALLVAASRLLEKPLGAILRGPAGCGKSALIGAVGKVLPLSEVLYFSRMTAQSLYFLPKEQLSHKLLICDEYEGLEDSEYALRCVMSNQTLSLAITLREGGRVPVTRTVEIPARLSVLVSTTGAINVENLSRFVELKLDVSPEQTARVMLAQARASVASKANPADLQILRNAAQCLKPCLVDIPYADELVYASGNVLARRQFAQVVGLISAHAALYQYQRETRVDEGRLIVTATRDDHRAVHPLLAAVVDHFEESLSPAAMQMLEELARRERPTFSLKDILGWMGWTYSKAYRVSRELVRVDLLIPDHLTNGVERRFEAAPYFRTQRGISQIAPPAAS